MKVLLLDNYDSFTYNLYDYLLQTGVSCRVLRNDALTPEQFDQYVRPEEMISPNR